MMRSFYSGISGLKNHVTRLDVIGNNVANVNTVGFKASRVLFQDIYSQTAKSGSAGSDTGLGGVNPSQIGLGVKLASINVVHTSAATQGTDRPLDFAIEGDGFFIVADFSTTPPTKSYTRVGNFELDDQGYLVAPGGYYVMGFVADPATGVIDTSDPANLERIRLRYPAEEPVPNPDYDPDPTSPTYDPEPYERDSVTNEIVYQPKLDAAGNQVYADYLGLSVEQDGTITAIVKDDITKIARISLAMFSNPSGLEKAGNSLYRQTSASGDPQITTPLTDGSGKINAGGLEMSNVDLATEFTDMIVTQRGYQANSRIITVADSMLEELVNLKR